MRKTQPYSFGVKNKIRHWELEKLWNGALAQTPQNENDWKSYETPKSMKAMEKRTLCENYRRTNLQVGEKNCVLNLIIFDIPNLNPNNVSFYFFLSKIMRLFGGTHDISSGRPAAPCSTHGSSGWSWLGLGGVGWGPLPLRASSAPARRPGAPIIWWPGRG